VKKQVGPISYHLKLLPALQQLHPVFYVVKLITISEDSIPRRCSEQLPDPIIIDRKKEWKMKKIFNSC